jgi:tRNA(Ser,Leu) C12 N-acetylase TAN1
MRDWNVVATSAEGRFGRAMRFLMQFGPAAKTPFYNVIQLQADNVPHLLEFLADEWEAGEGRLLLLHRVVPVTFTFNFQDHATFQNKAAELVISWAPQLSGKGFHVRMRRRGFKDTLRSVDEEQFLNRTLVEATGRAGQPGYVAFDDPDAIVAVETIGTDAGISLWFRDDLKRYPFLGLD